VTFAIARHAAVDLSQVLHADTDTVTNRLSQEDVEHMRRQLEDVGLHPKRSPEADARLAELRKSYEPYVLGLGRSLMMPVPPWWRASLVRDNWQTSPRRDGGPHL
jgi:hypothetical protein